MKNIIICILLCTACTLSAREEGGGDTVKEGNLALPTSQQPAPLFSFGQNIIDQGDILAYLDTFCLKSRHAKFISIVPSALYGITDDLSLFVRLPIAAKFQADNHCSHGLDDLFMQLEYAYYNDDHDIYANQMTFAGSITLPTGSPQKNPVIGLGSPSFFLGGTASHLAIDWYTYASLGAIFTTRRHGTRYGNEFLYQAGVGRNIGYKSNRWLLTAVLECNGIYSQRDTINCICDPNSGGNIFFIGPCLWFTTEQFTLHIGMQFPVAQHLFGIQNKEKWIAAISIGWKFNAPT